MELSEDRKTELEYSANVAKAEIDFLTKLPATKGLDLEYILLLYISSENLLMHSENLVKQSSRLIPG